MGVVRVSVVMLCGTVEHLSGWLHFHETREFATTRCLRIRNAKISQFTSHRYSCFILVTFHTTIRVKSKRLTGEPEIARKNLLQNKLKTKHPKQNNDDQTKKPNKRDFFYNQKKTITLFAQRTLSLKLSDISKQQARWWIWKRTARDMTRFLCNCCVIIELLWLSLVV